MGDTSFLYITNLFIQNLRLVRVLSDQNTKWKLHLFFLLIRNKNSLFFPPITIKILIGEDVRRDAALRQWCYFLAWYLFVLFRGDFHVIYSRTNPFKEGGDDINQVRSEFRLKYLLTSFARSNISLKLYILSCLYFTGRY